MFEIFLKTIPFFCLIGLGYAAARAKFFSPQATAHLTKFVFYFALSAMLFKFSANLALRDILDWTSISAYFTATLAIYLIVTLVAIVRRRGIEEGAIEAQCAVIGNVGFLGLPMLALLMGPESVGPIMMVLFVDLIFFGSLVVILITGSRDGRVSIGILKTVGLGLLKNPMIVSITLGVLWAAFELPIPDTANVFLDQLAGAATPGALFAIGASLAAKSAERVQVALWLSSCKLVLHPLAVACAALFVFDVNPYTASVMIAAAALPTAGNVFMVAQHYGTAPQRVSSTILISTVLSIVTVSVAIGLV